MTKTDESQTGEKSKAAVNMKPLSSISNPPWFEGSEDDSEDDEVAQAKTVEDAKVKERQYTFHLDTFNHDTERKSNYLDKHKKLIAAGYPEHLRHPIMKFFAAMKWQPHRKRYLFNFQELLVN